MERGSDSLRLPEVAEVDGRFGDAAGRALDLRQEVDRTGMRAIGGCMPTYEAKGPGYYPFPNQMEGGFSDRIGRLLRALQDFLRARAHYVSWTTD
jgi:hypothetical protein